LGGHEAELLAIRAEGTVEATGQHTGLEAGDAEEGHLAEGDALDGEDFLGVDGAVEVDGVLAEVVEGLEVFEADDGEGGAGKAVLRALRADWVLPAAERGPVDF
jgi:hypothetical protein